MLTSSTTPDAVYQELCHSASQLVVRPAKRLTSRVMACSVSRLTARSPASKPRRLPLSSTPAAVNGALGVPGVAMSFACGLPEPADVIRFVM